MPHAEMTSWFALKMVDGVGAIAFRALLDAFVTPEAVFAATERELLAVPGINKKVAAGIKKFVPWKEAERQAALLERSDIGVVTFRDQNYPRLLAHIYDAPPLLFVRGRIQADDVGVAVVGSRRASAYGLHTTSRLSLEMVQRGITVVSGLARGIDTAAHQGAIAGRGRTIAVIGCGLDVVYPAENKVLFSKIPESGGAIVSEYFLGTPPNREHFPLRNRIISGMSLGVLVVEATDKSGSLITANIAAEQGREVFAVPGPIDSCGSRGTHLMLKNGAKLVECVEDILEEIAPQLERVSATGCERPPSPATAVVLPKRLAVPSNPSQHPPMPLGTNEKRLLSMLSAEQKSLDDLVRASGIPAKDVLSAMALLEIKGIVKQLPGKTFIIIEERNV